MTLTEQQMPVHAHVVDTSGASGTVRCRDATGNQATPGGHVPAMGTPYVPFIDDPLSAGGTTVKAVHIAELRSRIDTLRATVALGPYPYGGPGPGARGEIPRCRGPIRRCGSDR